MNSGDLAKRGRAITGALLVVQSIGSAGVIASLTVAAILGSALTENAFLAGVPAAVFQLGAALTALPWSLATDRIGRRWGLGLAVLVGSAGAAGAVAAAALGSFTLLVVALVVMGSAQAAFKLSRFTAAEVTPVVRRGRAVATVILGGTVGSVLGPLMVRPSGALTSALGLGELAGPYLVASVLFLLGAVVLLLFLRPEPKLVAAELAAHEHSHEDPLAARPLREIGRDSGVRTAVLVMVGSYVVMVVVMGMTSLHMHDHAHHLGAISLVMSAHTIGMFAFSPVTGRLADRWGRRPTIMLGAVALMLGCIGSVPSVAVVPLMAALLVLGVGWNLCYIGGSALLADRLSVAEKARTQGISELLIGLTSAASSLLSGFVYAGAGYGVMSWLGAGVSLLMFVLLWQTRTVTALAGAAD